MPNYSKSAASALKLLTKFGQNVTRRAYTIGTYDPATGLVTNTYADTTLKGVLFDFASGQTLERGTLIQTGDKRLYVDASATISPQDHFIVDTIEYTIVSIGELKPAGTSILFDIHLRT